MTVPSTDNRRQYSGNGSTTNFAYPKGIFKDSDLTVYLVDTSDGSSTLQTLSTDYTVTNAGSANGGDVVFTTAPASGKRVVILREVAVTQNTQLRNQGAYTPESLEDELDRRAMVDFQLQDSINRSLRVSKDDLGAEDDFTLPIQSTRKGKIASYDGNGLPSVTTEQTSPGIAVDSVADLRAENVANKKDGDVAQMLGYTTPGDGGGGTLYWDASSTETDNGGTIFKPDSLGAADPGRWKLRYNIYVSLAQFGAFGADGTVNETAQIRAAITAANDEGFTLFVPYGVYLWDGITHIQPFDVSILGDLMKRPRFIGTASADRMFRFTRGDADYDATGMSITADIKPNDTGATLNDVSALEEGMIIAFVSDKPWFHDDRGNTFRGEMHLIEGIDSGTGRITFTDQTRDFYATTDGMTIKAWKPDRISVKNIEAVHPSGGTACFQIERTKDSVFENIYCEGTTTAGVWLLRPWDARVQNLTANHIGQGTSGGYGLQDRSGVGTKVDGIYTFGCRRGFDFHGLTDTPTPARDWVVENYIIRGGGDYFPDTAEISYGGGTHGPSEHGRIGAGIFANVEQAARIRSRDTVIDGAKFIGRIGACVSASHGTGLIVRNCQGNRDDFPGKLASIGNALPDSGIETFVQFGVPTGGPWEHNGHPTIIENNTVYGLDKNFVRFEQTNDVERLTCRRNEVVGSAPSGKVTFYSASATTNITRSYLEMPTRHESESGGVDLFGSNLVLGYRSGQDSWLKIGEDTFYVTVPDDSFIRILNFTNQTRMWVQVFSVATDRAFYEIRQDSSNFQNLAGVAGTVDVSATPTALTGTAGTDGNTTIGLSAGTFYLENRKGSQKTYIIRRVMY